MNSRDWKQVWALYEKASSLPPEEWENHLEHCATEGALRDQVLCLLRDPQSSMGSGGVSAKAVRDRTGTRVGHYRITKLLGQGGMGEVYSAHDEVLDRPVALKFVSPELAGRAAADVMREAKCASTLNHPYIVTVHEVVSDESIVIVMEMVPGSSLRSICGSPVPPAKVAAYGQQIARALAAAHAAGIVHRDVKPENVMLRPDGYIKLLDFGLAHDLASDADRVASRPLGTWRYMSPEQIRGEILTGKSDVFSLGVVLYELLTGKHPFPAPTIIETLRAVTTAEPAGPAQAPPWMAKLIFQMLSKPPAGRPAAEQVAERLGGETAVPRAWPRRALISGLAASLAGGGWYLSRKAGVPPPDPVSIQALANLPGAETQPAFSPDGKEILLVFRADQEWNSHIYRKSLAGGDPRRLTSGKTDEVQPTWSPDGKQIAFLRLNGTNWSVMVIPASGSAPRRIGQIADLGHGFRLLTWRPDSRAVVVSDLNQPGSLDLALFAILLETGERIQLTSPPHGKTDAIPNFSLDGKRLAFVRQGETGNGDLFVADADGRNPKQITTANDQISDLAWLPSGKELVLSWNRGGPIRLWRQPADGRQAARIEEITESSRDVAIAAGCNLLAYRTAMLADANIWQYSTASAERPVQLLASAATESDPAYSPDGSRIAFASGRSGHQQIYTCDRDGSNLRQLTSFGPHGVTGSPNWSPDGRLIAFDSRPSGSPSGIFVVDSQGGEARRLTGPGATDILPAFSHDGQWVYFSSDQSGRMEIWKVPLNGGAPVRVTAAGGFEGFASPDGGCLYYTKGQDQAGIWRLPAGGGEEVQLRELKAVVRHRYWQGARDGIYFLDLGQDPRLKFYSFVSRQVRTVALAPRPPVSRYRGLAVAPDQRHFLYMQYDVRRSAIMLAAGPILNGSCGS